MGFKVGVGPAQVVIHQGRTVLVCEPDGSIPYPSDKGLYLNDTRLISGWSVYAEGTRWDLLSGGAVDHDASRMHLTNRTLRTASGVIPERSLHLALARSIADGLHEDLDITNYSGSRVAFTLEIELRCDFADVFDAKAGDAPRRGCVATRWWDAARQLETAYANGDFERRVRVSARGDGLMGYANGRLGFSVTIEAGRSWHACLLYDLGAGVRDYPAPARCEHERPPTSPLTAAWRDEATRIRTSNEEFYRTYHQALEDVASLQLPQEGREGVSFVPAAGLPWFTALFGRDSLIASLQGVVVDPGFACATLDVLGEHQSREHDDERDAEPGKILHELRFGELAHFKLIPHTPYYGTADATVLYLVALHETWRWTGRADLLERHLETAEGCLTWIDRWGDRDGDGLQEYQTRSSHGYENMGWKDAGDSVRHPDGTPVRGPKALCELQGYVYDAWLRMAEMFEASGRAERALALRAKASTLFDLFNERYWDEESGFYAYCLDGEKRRVLTVASNVGHCLWSGIVPPERAKRVVERLMAPDMWSGWGIRTLSSEHPSYNPLSYQNGSVWPHDNAIIAAGLRRYGYAEEACRVARDLNAAAGHFVLNQMPELYAGLARKPGDFPVQYRGANVPQAWAAGSVFMLLRVILGLAPDAPHDRLEVDPALPAWLPDVTLLGLRVGRHVFDIDFRLENGATTVNVLNGDASKISRKPHRNHST